MSLPILDSETTISIAQFNEKKKEEIIKLVIRLAIGTILDGLKCNWSAEGGFELPLTSEWKQAISEQNARYSSLLQYHSMREFRFVCNNSKIDRLYTKNSMRWWTSKEKQQFKILLEQAVTRTLSPS